ncbi:hypothetical protein EYZ11_009592 [Aspergillus tanneri]|uniref:Uncharacterized protein n=1 Tax=Aspergillus tanneri TaxID=1220188 RepID=A0A4S3J7Y6_9EURO|nr:hypothetical protein EYZ11_009592 [Aspergillus tanneri]
MARWGGQNEINSISGEQLDNQHVVLLLWCYRAYRATSVSDEYKVDWGFLNTIYTPPEAGQLHFSQDKKYKHKLFHPY